VTHATGLRARPMPLALLVLLGLAAATPAASGTLTLVRGPHVIELTLEDLALLPRHELLTGHEFTDAPVTYAGPLAREVLGIAGLDREAIVRFTAANDYAVEIPTSDFQDYDAVLALEADGRPLSRRDKGPIWLMYPISDHPELAGPTHSSRLVWQVVRIEAQ
jgi:hypothetical protein